MKASGRGTEKRWGGGFGDLAERGHFFFFNASIQEERKTTVEGAGGEGDLYHNLHILWPHWPSAAAKGREVRWFETKAVKKRRMATSQIMSLTSSCLPYRE